MKLLVLPEDGMTAVVNAIKAAKTSIDTTIFRFDRAEIEKALEAAVGRGVQACARSSRTPIAAATSCCASSSFGCWAPA